MRGRPGSGKTTTLYATLAEINDDAMKVMTIEDPVEYVIPSINQIQINEQAGMTFAAGLRVDPAPGPRRRSSSARSATSRPRASPCSPRSRATSCCRHCTPPTPVAALHRFLDMGIESFLIASSVLGVVGQRLVRRNCPHCVEAIRARPWRSSPSSSAAAARSKSGVHPGAGCNFCAHTGYFERVGVYELLRVTEELT